MRTGIRWHTGAIDGIAVARAAHLGTAKRSSSPGGRDGDPPRPHYPTAELAELLNTAGLTIGTRAPFDDARCLT
ncbi:hypothetical protein [Mycobacterium riyadhense]|uniref:hypothetical protein n=1 Tax=Mycobacterium riyadhense TaxID=486698 RepID=UPI001959CD4E|nr:hypothetical protein [Mycobacterium riyadhense]